MTGISRGEDIFRTLEAQGFLPQYRTEVLNTVFAAMNAIIEQAHPGAEAAYVLVFDEGYASSPYAPNLTPVGTVVAPGTRLPGVALVNQMNVILAGRAEGGFVPGGPNPETGVPLIAVAAVFGMSSGSVAFRFADRAIRTEGVGAHIIMSDDSEVFIVVDPSDRTMNFLGASDTLAEEHQVVRPRMHVMDLLSPRDLSAAAEQRSAGDVDAMNDIDTHAALLRIIDALYGDVIDPAALPSFPTHGLSTFVTTVLRSGSVWTLRDASGFPTSSQSGRKVMPFWSSQEAAAALVMESREYAGFTPVPIPLVDWRASWLPGLARDGISVGVNWSGSQASGHDHAPDVIAAELNRHAAGVSA